MHRSAPAKINLGLHLLDRRADGYHEIETVLLPIGWTDELVYRDAETFSLSCSDHSLPTDWRNLVWRAAEALALATKMPMTGALYLDKNVPYGAGLGSGSSDAAAALRLLRDAWGAPATDRELLDIAKEIGSDVPFFMNAVPSIATGRGEISEPLGGALAEAYPFPFSLVVVVPDVRVSTAEAYRWVAPRPNVDVDLGGLVRSNDLARWRTELRNDFQEPVVDRFPEVGALIRALEDAGAGYVSLSGSGSAAFGVFEDAAVATETAAFLERAGCRVWEEKGSRI